MSELSKIKSVDGSTAEWLSSMGTKYGADDLTNLEGTPLERGLIDWSDKAVKLMKKNITKTKSTATRALFQSVGALPVFKKSNSLVSQIVGEDYIDYLEKGVSGTEVKISGTPFKFKKFPKAKTKKTKGKKYTPKKGGMVYNLQTYIAAKPIRVTPTGKQNTKDANLSLAYLMAKSIRRKGIKARTIYGDVIDPNGKSIKELKDMVGKQIGGAVAATIAREYTKP